MHGPGRFSHFQGYERAKRACRFSALTRWIFIGVIVSAFAAFMPSTMPSGIVMAQDSFDGVYSKAEVSFRQGKYEEALGLYKKANRMKQDSSLECLWGMAQAYSKLGAYKNSVQTCDRLIQLGGDNVYFLANAWNLRGNELSASATENPEKLDQDKLREAEAAYREVLRVSPSLNMAHYNIGIALIRMNRVKEGVEELQTYVRSAQEADIAEKARKIIQDPRRAVENFAPDFSFITSDGEYLSSDDLRGKILLIDFWGAWCQPCINSIPFLSDLTKKHRKDAFVLISVDANDEELKWRECIERNKMNWTHTRDVNAKLQRLFQISFFPSYILIDHEGIIRYRGKGSGMQTEGEVTNMVKKALKDLDSSPNRQDGTLAASSGGGGSF